jgi:hypothetical protein
MSNNDIFVSHSLKDEKMLENVFKSLKNQNYRLFIRNRMDNYDNKYSNYIEPLMNSKLIICFLTQNYTNDDDCIADLIICRNNSIAVIMVVYDIHVNTYQFVNSLDFIFQPVIFNVPDDIEHFDFGFGLNFAKFLNQIDKILQPPPLKPIEIPPPKPSSKFPLKPPPIPPPPSSKISKQDVEEIPYNVATVQKPKPPPQIPGPPSTKPFIPFYKEVSYNNNSEIIQKPKPPPVSPPLVSEIIKPFIPFHQEITNNNEILERPNTLKITPKYKIDQPVISEAIVKSIIINKNPEITDNNNNNIDLASVNNSEKKSDLLDLKKLFEEKVNLPECHYNCRFDSKNGGSKLFTRTTNISVS